MLAGDTTLLSPGITGVWWTFLVIVGIIADFRTSVEGMEVAGYL